MSIHYLERIESGNRDGLCLCIRWNKARMIVHIDPSPAGDLMQDSLIKEYEDAICNSQREEDAMADKILDTIVEVGRSTFDQLIPPKDKPAPPPSLHSLLFPEEFTFLLHTRHKDGKWMLENSAQGPDLSLRGALPLDLELIQGAGLPTFSTKDIFVVDEIISDGRVSRVIVEDQEMCAKTAIHLPTESLQKELESLLKIRASKYADTIRVPKILGFVKSPVHAKIIGFLSQYIPPPDVLSLVSLEDVKASSFAASRRKKWATQVRETVERLHEVEVAWGHAAPSNVLIHNDTDDAWVIDFDGGWMYGWTKRIVEIDQEEVDKIFQLLEV
ncbi:uncharacterized protein NECHADRAFT_85496 [Fusarium vanettenii 77-13-4]|uniref:Protein kinase domain-containing protein n=1 Tax=Fusarium vanettenii (strain ATCC MYA-4622 / CBS 123669 / FGSC 9596 / NRRL 45880 / 77-13-4) TaxID=660122 RepID=C7ZP10_FUSV7|nr:uncharacterized protein NECHADRAFT_85496 [Fusarium vanettenii 77-13-4]EEU34228.1 predicted protein [Fusarium vanettenii 77-13-4]